MRWYSHAIELFRVNTSSFDENSGASIVITHDPYEDIYAENVAFIGFKINKTTGKISSLPDIGEGKLTISNVNQFKANNEDILIAMVNRADISAYAQDISIKMTNETSYYLLGVVLNTINMQGNYAESPLGCEEETWSTLMTIGDSYIEIRDVEFEINENTIVAEEGEEGTDVWCKISIYFENSDLQVLTGFDYDQVFFDEDGEGNSHSFSGRGMHMENLNSGQKSLRYEQEGCAGITVKNFKKVSNNIITGKPVRCSHMVMDSWSCTEHSVFRVSLNAEGE